MSVHTCTMHMKSLIPCTFGCVVGTVTWLAALFAENGCAGAVAHQNLGSASPVEALVRRIESEQPRWVVRSKDQDVYALTVSSKNVSDENLALISQIPHLTELKLFVQSQARDLTPKGIAELKRLKNLDGLNIECPRVLNPGMLSAICELRSLRRLRLNWAVPPAGEYACLTNLNRLEELALYGTANFTDRELGELVPLPILKRLSFSQTGLSTDWPTIVRKSQSLQEVTVRNDWESLTWTRDSAH